MLGEGNENDRSLFFCWRKKKILEYCVKWMSKWEGKLKKKSVVYQWGN